MIGGNITKAENTIYCKVKALCEEREITIKELERTIGVGNATIAHWKSSTPNLATLTKVADYFEVSLDALTKEDVEGNEEEE